MEGKFLDRGAHSLPFSCLSIKNQLAGAFFAGAVAQRTTPVRFLVRVRTLGHGRRRKSTGEERDEERRRGREWLPETDVGVRRGTLAPRAALFFTHYIRRGSQPLAASNKVHWDSPRLLPSTKRFLALAVLFAWFENIFSAIIILVLFFSERVNP